MTESVRRIAVTGSSGYIGARLIERLEQENQVDGILAIDVRPPKKAHGPKVELLGIDVSQPFGYSCWKWGADAVVHLAYVLRPGRDRAAIRRVNVNGAANVLAACTSGDSPRTNRFVYLSSTSVYGAHPDSPPMLTEDDTPRPIKGFQYSEDKTTAESLIEGFARDRTQLRATILRTCPVLGPNADNFIARAFLKPMLVAVRGYDPPMQFVHEDDLTDVLVRCVLGDATGVYNVAGEGTIRWSEMATLLGRRLVALPAVLLYPGAQMAWALRLQSESPSCGLDFIRYRWTASTAKIKRELGVSFRHTSRKAVEAFAAHNR